MLIVDALASTKMVVDATARRPAPAVVPPRWVELRDAQGKLQGKWDPGAGVLEIQARGVKTRYRLVGGD